jgi:hypothetical protein
VLDRQGNRVFLNNGKIANIETFLSTQGMNAFFVGHVNLRPDRGGTRPLGLVAT